MRGLGIAAIILGALHLVRATKSESAVPLTAVPESLRPRLKRAIGAATSPAGAFISGAAVALFLLPCTIGPYVVGCGMLAALSPADAAVYLLLYNAIFVLPMIAITLAIGLGVARSSACSLATRSTHSQCERIVMTLRGAYSPDSCDPMARRHADVRIGHPSGIYVG